MPERDELFDLFLSESRDHLEQAEISLLRLEKEPGSLEDVQSCFRAMHTIKGSSGFLEMVRLQTLAHGSESLLERIRSGTVPVTPAAIEALLQTVSRLRNELSNIDSGSMTMEPDDRDLLDVLAALETAHAGSAASTSAGAPEGISPDLLEDFIPEVTELINQTESFLVNSVLTPQDIDGALRALSTLNSICTYLGFPELATRSAIAEKRLQTAEGNPRTSLDEVQHQELQGEMEQIRGLVDELGKPSGSGTGAVPAIGEILVKQGLPRETLDEVVSRLAPGERLGDKLVLEDKVSRQVVEKAASHQRALRSGGEGYSRVSTKKLEDLVNLVGELAIASNDLFDDPAMEGSPRLRAAVDRQSRIMRDLQKLALNLRMVPLRSTFTKISRAAHDTAYKLDKKMAFTVHGEDTEIDRTIADGLTDPLLHMIRNAIDHGIEPLPERLKAGKPECSQIRLTAAQAGDHVVLVLTDDGPGMNTERIRAKGVASGLIPEHALIETEDLFQLIFEPGFSTADQVTEISGRGVGMDVVKRNVQNLNGTIEISSEVGQGTRFTIKVPLTTAILEALVVRVGTMRFLMPVGSVIEVVQGRGEPATSGQGRARVVESRGRMLPISNLCDLLGIAAEDCGDSSGVLLIIEHFNGRYALEVGEILGQLQVVVKPLSNRIPRHPGLSGSAILADGRVSLILDPNHLLPAAVGA